MSLIDPGTTLPLEELQQLRMGLLTELREIAPRLEDPAHAADPVRARGHTARQLVRDTLAWADAAGVPEDRIRFAAEINLLYDVTIVAAEYYKLFLRSPSAARPAGRI